MRRYSHRYALVSRMRITPWLPQPRLIPVPVRSSSTQISNQPSLATTGVSPITKSRSDHATDAVSIMDARNSGYIPFGTALFNPITPSFVPPQQNQPTYTLPLGHANELVPSPSIGSNASHLGHKNPGANIVSRRSRSPGGTRPRDKITSPSKASGGVPDPTPEYLALASHPPLLLPHPRNILVVIDMNGTLLYRPNRRDPTRFVERPYARPFLSYCINTFTVVIWSSARPDNVNNMCKQLLTSEDRSKVVAVWGRDSFGLSQDDYNQRVQCYKRLSMLWNNPVVAASHPMAATGEKWSQLNTVLVDDSLEKARSEPYNLVQIPEFEGNAKEPGFVLPQVHDYLNDCSRQTNISAYMRDIPFKIKPGFTL
ncbi:HAD-like domain-containing protein [Xylariaceae sp. FL1651]|nr:HAD-like domain-containing protein [Xylariaceae sp. FL1651]